MKAQIMVDIIMYIIFYLLLSSLKDVLHALVWAKNTLWARPGLSVYLAGCRGYPRK
jgi:hypothetical protein